MSEGLFVPPEGAMQFEYLHSCTGFYAHWVGTALWVTCAEPANWADFSCACKLSHRIYEKDGSFLSGPEGKLFAVCACNGRIIE